ncbi:MAG: hypothetical protein ACRETQ_10640 [Gammaproteobacteria bacterium]
MLIFLDTEFTGLSADPALISLGLVSEDDRTFYAELTDTWDVESCDFFVQENVLPLLEGGTLQVTWQELVERLPTWISSFAEPVQAASDAVAWDWEWVQKACYASGRWPHNLSHQPVSLPAGVAELDSACNHFESRQLRRHHALDDARAMRLGWLAAQAAQLGPT